MNNKSALVLGSLLLLIITAALALSSRATIKPTPNESELTDSPDSWGLYPSSLQYKISYPKDYVIEPSGQYSITMFKLSDEPGAGPANLVYVSVVQPNMVDNEGDIYGYNPNQFKKLQTLEIGESISLADPDQPVFDQYMTYTRVDDTVIDGHTAKRFENNKPWEKPEGTTEVRYLFEDNRYNYEEGGIIYILGYYYGGEGVTDPIDAREAFNIVSSFRLR